MIAIEPEFDKMIRSIGGIVLRDIIPNSPSFLNADYVLHDHSIVAELKCLEDNKLEDPKHMQKLADAWSRWQQKGLVTGDTPELIATHTLPPECIHELVAISTKPLKKRIEKANRQIRETKKHLKIPHYKGLLLMANDGNFALPPRTLQQLVGNAISTSYSNINTFVIFSVNMLVSAPGIDIPFHPWLPGCRTPESSIAEASIRLLAEKWFAHQEAIEGKPMRRLGDGWNK